MLALPGQLFSFCSKSIVAKYQSRVDGMADFRYLLLAQVICEQASVS